MVKIAKTGSTLKQTAYARRIWGAQGKDKQQIALDVGYSKYIAATPKSKIENSRGFNNAMARLAADSNNLALTVMSELKARGFTDFSNKDLVGALNAISGAWKNFNNIGPRKEDEIDNGKNRLRTVILQRIENQTIQAENPKIEGSVEEEKVGEDMDF